MNRMVARKTAGYSTSVFAELGDSNRNLFFALPRLSAMGKGFRGKSIPKV